MAAWSSFSDEVLEAWADAEFCYLTTSGRRTGKPHTIEIWFAVHDRCLYMLAGGRYSSDWIKNLSADGRVSVRVGDLTLSGQASVLEAGTPEDALARRLLVEKYEPIEGSSLANWGRTSLPVAIELMPPA